MPAKLINSSYVSCILCKKICLLKLFNNAFPSRLFRTFTEAKPVPGLITIHLKIKDLQKVLHAFAKT